MKPLSKENQEICRQLILANECVAHSEEFKGEESKEILLLAKCHAENAYFKLCEAIIGGYTYAAIPFTEIHDVLNKYPNKRVHAAIKELLGDEVYNKIKKE